MLRLKLARELEAFGFPNSTILGYTPPSPYLYQTGF